MEAVEPAISWPSRSRDWLLDKPTEEWKRFFDENGFLVVRNLIDEQEIQIYRDIYQKMLVGEIDTSSHRHDLGSHEKRKTDQENICQIMWPSLFVCQLDEGPIHVRTKQVARVILGDDMAFDFDMLISKAPMTNTLTPWHQDESYWPDLPDKRATTCWVALDDVTKDNGCMWFGPGSHKKPLRTHRPAVGGNHVLMCDFTEEEGMPQEIPAGSCTFHHGRTLHYARGNITGQQRRAYITNYRPPAMVQQMRSVGFDHAKSGLKNILAKTKFHTESRDE